MADFVQTTLSDVKLAAAVRRCLRWLNPCGKSSRRSPRPIAWSIDAPAYIPHGPRRRDEVPRSRDARWRKHAAGLEKEMLRRGMIFEVIDWTNGQAELPLKYWLRANSLDSRPTLWSFLLINSLITRLTA